MVVAIDGPAGSGKGTLAKELSKRYNLVNIDTGATYRALTLKVLRNNLTLENQDEIVALAKNINIEMLTDGTILLDGEDVTKEIRSKEVTNLVSYVSSNKDVREIMVDIQRNIANGKNVVMEGRDITTVVFPNAEYKFYLDASVETRADRRFKENQEKGIEMTYDEVKQNIIDRDYNDMHKEVGALVRTDDQIYIDSSNMTIEEEIEFISKIIKKEPIRKKSNRNWQNMNSYAKTGAEIQ